MRWIWVILAYVVWNLCAYTLKFKGATREIYDYIYWLNERLFVVVVFWVMAKFLPPRYKWLAKTFLCVAIYKLGYIILVIAGVIKPNDFASLMGVIFTAILGIVIFKIEWQKRL